MLLKLADLVQTFVEFFRIEDLDERLLLKKLHTTGCPNKKFPVTPGSILSQSQAFSTESNQSKSSIHVNIMVPGVMGNFLLGHPV